VQDPLAEFILGENPAAGSTFEATYNEKAGKLEIKLASKSKADAKKK